MQVNQPNLFTRSDTFFGVCQGLGEDLRISPLLLRLGFAALLFFQPVTMVITYLGAGILVALSRWVAPNPRAVAAAESVSEVRAEERNEPQPEPVKLAA